MDWFDVIFEDSSLKTYEFTKRAIKRIDNITATEQFKELDDPKMIFHFLLSETKIVPFGEYLKRYIYFKAGLDCIERFSQISNDVYKDIIIDTFKENKVPFSFEPTTRRLNSIIDGWLTKNVVSRNTVFLLGFGLHMSEEDVEEFLTKILKEDTFHFTDITETIYWYCFHNQLTFAHAKNLIEKYTSDSVKVSNMDEMMCSNIMKSINPKDISNEKELNNYLLSLMMSNNNNREQTNAYLSFMRIYNELGEKLRVINRRSDVHAGIKSKESYNDNYAVDIERALYSGLRASKDNNLPKASLSSLFNQFDGKRLGRQRISYIVGRKCNVERFDLITAKFLEYALRAEENEEIPIDRMTEFIEDTNKLLNFCGMTDIYPVNPYEAFILICLLSEYPLMEYSDVISISYNGEEAWIDE